MMQSQMKDPDAANFSNLSPVHQCDTRLVVIACYLTLLLDMMLSCH